MDSNQPEYLSQMTLELLRKSKVSPSPENYFVFYEHVASRNTALSSVLSVYLSNNRPIEAENLRGLFESFVAPSLKDANTATVEDLEIVIDQTLKTVSASEASARELAGEAFAAATTLDHAGYGKNQIVAEAVKKLANAARTAVSRARTAEAELQSNRTETAKIRERFDLANKAALTDGLTGIANRKNFDQTLNRLAASSMESGHPLCLAMIDIDHFKTFNDIHGHRMGDNVIKLVAHRLVTESRAEDFAARYGGEEFVLIMANTPRQVAETILDRIRQSLASKVLTKRDTGQAIGSVTISCGIAQFTFGEPLGRLIERADQALYRAKNGGRNRVVVAEQ